MAYDGTLAGWEDLNNKQHVARPACFTNHEIHTYITSIIFQSSASVHSPFQWSRGRQVRWRLTQNAVRARSGNCLRPARHLDVVDIAAPAGRHQHHPPWPPCRSRRGRRAKVAATSLRETCSV